MLPGGSYNVTAHYAGNGTFAASDSTPGIPVTVGKESSLTEVRLVTFSATAPPVYNVTTVPYGSPYVLRMDVTNSSGQLCASATTGLISYPCPTGALTVSPAPTEENPPPGTIAGSYTLNSQGYAEDQPIQQTPGTYNFVASYAGDNSYTAKHIPHGPDYHYPCTDHDHAHGFALVEHRGERACSFNDQHAEQRRGPNRDVAGLEQRCSRRRLVGDPWDPVLALHRSLRRGK